MSTFVHTAETDAVFKKIREAKGSNLLARWKLFYEHVRPTQYGDDLSMEWSSLIQKAVNRHIANQSSSSHIVLHTVQLMDDGDGNRYFSRKHAFDINETRDKSPLCFDDFKRSDDDLWVYSYYKVPRDLEKEGFVFMFNCVQVHPCVATRFVVASLRAYGDILDKQPENRTPEEQRLVEPEKLSILGMKGEEPVLFFHMQKLSNVKVVKAVARGTAWHYFEHFIEYYVDQYENESRGRRRDDMESFLADLYERNFD